MIMDEKKKTRKKELRQQMVCEWLQSNYLDYERLRYDEVANQVQISDSIDNTHWRFLDERDLNSMVCQCVSDVEHNITKAEMVVALRSNLLPRVHPLRDYLHNLKPYDIESNEPDWLAKKAAEVTVLNPDQQGMFEVCFKKWFVAMVASWLKDEIINHTVFVLIGRQGIFKTTWLERLMPDKLRNYMSKFMLEGGNCNRDVRARLYENGLLNIDELDAMNSHELNVLKSMITTADVNDREVYAVMKTRHVRLASFCGSTNKREFLTDLTGNRRWLPFEVESIYNPFLSLVPTDRMYAQAVYLFEQGFNYWFDKDDIEKLEGHNEDYRMQEREEEILPLLFDSPALGKGEFLTITEISDHLTTYGNIKRPMSTRALGVLMRKAGFEPNRQMINGRRVRGYVVHKRTRDEIDLLKKSLVPAEPVETEEDSGTDGQQPELF